MTSLSEILAEIKARADRARQGLYERPYDNPTSTTLLLYWEYYRTDIPRLVEALERAWMRLDDLSSHGARSWAVADLAQKEIEAILKGQSKSEMKRIAIMKGEK